jgi:hypothetical protein
MLAQRANLLREEVLRSRVQLGIDTATLLQERGHGARLDSASDELCLHLVHAHAPDEEIRGGVVTVHHHVFEERRNREPLPQSSPPEPVHSISDVVRPELELLVPGELLAIGLVQHLQHHGDLDGGRQVRRRIGVVGVRVAGFDIEDIERELALEVSRGLLDERVESGGPWRLGALAGCFSSSWGEHREQEDAQRRYPDHRVVLPWRDSAVTAAWRQRGLTT